MTNVNLLNAKIKNSGLKIQYISNQLDISRAYFYKKTHNEAEFKASEIDKLAKLLNLSRNDRDNIFFAENVD